VFAAARRLRRYFDDLGLVAKPQKRRLQGRVVDRGRIRDLAVKGDPRVMVARHTERATDLFIGVAIDCSGSMGGAKMEKARLFGTMLAEALRGHRGVDLRLFGFEHNVIWDVGTAARCAVHRLQAGGGNNDAAALQHIAGVARQSRRRARLLVMISDGLPSDCTVNALRSLVGRLSRQKYCCAQVAVQAISDVCFPHYVLVEDGDFDAAVRRFGSVVGKLVGRALAQS
jgi:Mg-chelatase subunit ChlD